MSSALQIYFPLRRNRVRSQRLGFAFTARNLNFRVSSGWLLSFLPLLTETRKQRTVEHRLLIFANQSNSSWHLLFSCSKKFDIKFFCRANCMHSNQKQTLWKGGTVERASQCAHAEVVCFQTIVQDQTFVRFKRRVKFFISKINGCVLCSHLRGFLTTVLTPPSLVS